MPREYLFHMTIHLRAAFSLPMVDMTSTTRRSTFKYFIYSYNDIDST